LASARRSSGYGLWCGLIAQHGIVKLAPFLLTVPIIAIGLGVGLLGEELTVLMVVGGGITLAGVAMTLERVSLRSLQATLGSKDA
jgi:O-acetylserine/cysteine efflux transporter